MDGSLRDRNKARRRAAILDAARLLLREQDIAKTTVEQVAERAQVAAATVYNLVGPREQLILALIEDTTEQVKAALAELAIEEPVARAEAIITESIRFLAADTTVHRQALSAIRDWSPPQKRLQHDAALIQVSAFEDARAAGLLDRRTDTEAMALQVFTTYTGALYGWATGALDTDEFQRRALLGLHLIFAAVATDAHRPRFLERIHALSAHPPRPAGPEPATSS